MKTSEELKEYNRIKKQESRERKREEMRDEKYKQMVAEQKFQERNNGLTKEEVNKLKKNKDAKN